jgi:hypothetical protein
VRALAAGRADEDAVSLVPGSFEVGYVAEDGSAHRVALTDAWAVRFEATAPVRRFYSRKAQRAVRLEAAALAVVLGMSGPTAVGRASKSPEEAAGR